VEIVPFGKTDLGPAAQALVEKIAAGLGRIYEPLAAIIQAHADVQIAKIKVKGEVEIEDVRRRAIERLAAEETKKQQNLEAVYGKTFQLLEPSLDAATIGQMDEDWIVFHSEKARLVSDEEMQTLWARVMASEAAGPGSFSKRALEILGVLEKEEAHLFTSVCRFMVRDDSEPSPAIFHTKEAPAGIATIYSDQRVNFDMLRHLTTIGLLEFTSPFLTDNVGYYDAPTVELEYFGDRRTFRISKTHPSNGKYYINYGMVGLSKVGQQLARIAGPEPVPGFFDFLEARLANEGILRESSGKD
jgi:Protein of unknown function (DUF2806)